ncbi:PIG-L family deacetylase [Nocardioidaceae bacterium]|nr:PIG-L family deacetylase [Nocardioidaceae bacterium]
MSTVVFVHAHPDDEGTGTAGTMVRLVREGHRVVVVYATGGECGSVPDDLRADESLTMRRQAEAERSAEVTGVQRLIWLGYVDSGMTGWEQNAADRAFGRVDVDEAAELIATKLADETVDVLVGYDWHGGYGHPDHVMVHRATLRARDLLPRAPRYLESTMNRDRMRAMYEMAKQMADPGADPEMFDPDAPADDGNPFGTPAAEIDWEVDIAEAVATKRKALESHASQGDVQQILSMPEEIFAHAFGREYFVEPGLGQDMQTGWPFTSD